VRSRVLKHINVGAGTRRLTNLCARAYDDDDDDDDDAEHDYVDDDDDSDDDSDDDNDYGDGI
jgi:hypothetical protein